MTTSASSQGQLQRSGVQRLISDKRGRQIRAGGPGSGPRGGKKGSGNTTNRRPKIPSEDHIADALSRLRQNANDKDVSQIRNWYSSDGTSREWDKMGAWAQNGARALDKDKEFSSKFGHPWDNAEPGTHESRRFKASKIRESSFNHPFTEKGRDEISKPLDGKKQNGKGRVYLVTIIEEGIGNSRDRNFYSAEALQSGVKVFNGAKAYADHPDAITEKTLPERSMKDLVGWYSDCFVDKNPKTGKTRLNGKLHFFPSAKWLTSMIDTILTDPTAVNLFGISINAVGKTRQGQMGGEEVNYVEEFQRVDSADVVTEPAARGGFIKMLESRRNKVNRIMGSKSKRTREAGSLSPEKLKEVADSLVSAYNSDNPDEVKEAAFAASRTLHAAASISGKGPGQSNEEQYSNINPSGGKESMAKKHVKASAGSGKRGFRKGKRRLQASDGTGEDNQIVDEPDPEDTENELEEADVEDEEDRGDIGDHNDYGGDGKYQTVKASGNRRRVASSESDDDFEEGIEDEGMEGLEDEGMEGFEDEGMEDEDEDGMGGGMPPQAGGMGGGGGQPAGGGAPGSSRTVASTEGDDDGDMDDDDDDMDDMDEAFEDEGFDTERPNVAAEASNRRRPVRTSRGRRLSREADDSGQGAPIKKASYAGGLGHSGHSALPKGADPTRGYDDSDEDFGKQDKSTSGVGKSYKLKTSRFARNRRQARVAKPIVREANRRIEHLAGLVRRLRESVAKKEDRIQMFRGKLFYIHSGDTARRLLREAVNKEIIPENAKNVLLPQLFGKTVKQQIRKIKESAYFLESATEGALSRLQESVEGSGARGGFASWGTSGQNSDLQEGLAELGVPMKKDDE
jgi:hypothetical protein